VVEIQIGSVPPNYPFYLLGEDLNQWVVAVERKQVQLVLRFFVEVVADQWVVGHHSVHFFYPYSSLFLAIFE
jgi:hypothetical protein